MTFSQIDLGQLCGDYPAPCNCDNPATHDGAVEAVAEENSGANWRQAMEHFEGDSKEEAQFWYDQQSPIYSNVPIPAEIEAARRFVSHWLQGDNHGFIIPGTEWGKSLLGWLNVLVATPVPGGADLDQQPMPGLWPPRDRPLIDQVRERSTGPDHWINFLLYDHAWVDPPLTSEEITECLKEARRQKAEDENATRSKLGKEI